MRMDKKNNELSAFILLFIVTSHGKLQVRYIVDLPLMFVIWDTQLNSDMFLMGQNSPLLKNSTYHSFFKY